MNEWEEGNEEKGQKGRIYRMKSHGNGLQECIFMAVMGFLIILNY